MRKHAFHPASTPALTDGFTLMELLVVMAIVGIISAVAFPSYQSHVTKTRRGAATACLSEAAQAMERNFTIDMRYNTTTTLPALSCMTDTSSSYSYTFVTNEPTTTTFSIQAAPRGTHKDVSCGNLTLNHQGVKGPTTAGCWR